jgi:molybdenum cofactor cytidylyltransferase
MRIAALVLAAGLSRRMAPRNKLLVADESGRAMVTRVAAAAVASRADAVIAVTGHQAAAVTACLAGLGLQLVHAPDYAQGMSTSLKAGVAALPAGIAGVLVCLGDMPLVTPGLLDRLIAAFEAAARPAIIVPLCAGARGNPLLWDRAFFPAFATLTGDQGARPLLQRFAAHVVGLETGDDAVLRDFDTEEAFG